MSQFSSWFTRCYNKWKKFQPGEEDFLAFCELLGYPAHRVMNWLHGETEPQGSELLCIAGQFGTKVFTLLNQPEPDLELIRIYRSFPHLSGDNRNQVASAIWEAQIELKEKGLNAASTEAGEILKQAFIRWGVEISRGQ